LVQWIGGEVAGRARNDTGRARNDMDQARHDMGQVRNDMGRARNDMGWASNYRAIIDNEKVADQARNDIALVRE